MRGAFIKTLIDLAAQDARVILLTGDLGFMALEPFAAKFPDRFFNAGVAEQNMVGVATGLAGAGFVPFVYSITPFVSLRPYEFIRNGPIHHRLPVRIVGIGAGFEYSHQGITHFSLEDVGIMRIQPGLTVIAPADSEQAENAIRATWDMPGPVYYRLGKNDKITVPGLNGRFELGRLQIISEGHDLLFIVMGAIATEVVTATNQLLEQGLNCTVAVVSSLNPPPFSDLVNLLREFSTVITVEAHYIAGGVGSLVSEISAEHGLACRVVRCGIRTKPNGVTGSQSYMEELNGLSASALVKVAMQSMRNS
jgi:transketolase